MVDIQSVAPEIRRGKKEEEDRRRKKLQGKNIMAPLLHRAAIMTSMTCEDAWCKLGLTLTRTSTKLQLTSGVTI